MSVPESNQSPAQSDCCHGSFRIFLSYCSDDRRFADAIKAALGRGVDGLDVDVRTMDQVAAGMVFAPQLRSWISRAHVLVAILSQNSIRRPWVHQEIGYALASFVPVVALFSKVNPPAAGMPAEIQGVDISELCKGHDSADSLEGQWVIDAHQLLVNKVRWRDFLRPPAAENHSVYERSSRAAARTWMLASRAQEICREHSDMRIRQRSRLSSFSIPTTCAYGPWVRLSDKQRKQIGFWLQESERCAFDELARQSGCDLLIAPEYYDEDFDPVVQQARLLTLQTFLAEKQSDPRVRVVVDEKPENSRSGGSVTIIGNHWFSSSAAVAAAFYEDRETISTWHAPTVESQCCAFDQVFTGLHGEQERKIAPLSSREYAIQCIDKALKAVADRIGHGTAKAASL